MAGKNGDDPRGDHAGDVDDAPEDELEGLDGSSGAGGGEYDDMLLLDRLETLEEEMEELGVATLDDLRRRIRDLHAQLGD